MAALYNTRPAPTTRVGGGASARAGLLGLRRTAALDDRVNRAEPPYLRLSASRLIRHSWLTGFDFAMAKRAVRLRAKRTVRLIAERTQTVDPAARVRCFSCGAVRGVEEQHKSLPARRMAPRKLTRRGRGSKLPVYVTARCGWGGRTRCAGVLDALGWMMRVRASKAVSVVVARAMALIVCALMIPPATFQAQSSPSQTPAEQSSAAQNPSPQPPAPSPAATAPAPQEITTRTSQTPFQSSVNLVPVRVVVRDSKGAAVNGLQREDFQIYQDGKLQNIAHFSEITAASEAQQVVRGVATEPPPDNGPVPTSKLELPSRFVAMLFDDAHLSQSDLIQARVAANKYIDSVMDPATRLGVFTTSGQDQSDFTDDVAALHKAINTMMARPIGAFQINQSGQCPPMDYYEADLIQNKNDQIAFAAAIQDAIVCSTATNQQAAQSQATSLVYSTAQEVLSAGEINTQYSLRRLLEILKRITALPGQRSIVLVSPGFLTPTFESQVNDVIDRAERANVFINTLDARGLYVIDAIGDISQSAPQYATGQTAGQGAQYRIQGAQAQDDVMRELAAGTGGFAFLNNNDLFAGFERTAGKPDVSYLIAFAPSGLKNDGKFHTLKVKLTGKQHYDVQARRGFFAPKQDQTPDQLAKQDIEDAVFSQEEQATFPVQLHLQYFMTGTGNAKISVLAHVDVNGVHFDEHDGRHWDDLTVVAALFDRNGNFLQGDEQTLEMRLKDPTLARLERTGVTVKSNFDVKSGGYLVRLVVRDTKGSSIASKNGVVEIP